MSTHSESMDLAMLPIELVIEIVLYLNTYDVLETCSVFPELICLSFDMVVMRKVNLSAEYRFRSTHIPEFLHPDRTVLVKSLDISHLYWMSNSDLQRLVGGLPNLEQLFAIGTNFNWKASWDKTTKLKTLAASYFRGTRLPISVNKLYLHNVANKFVTEIVAIAAKLNNLSRVHVRLSEAYLDQCLETTVQYSIKSLEHLTFTFSYYRDKSVEELEKAFLDIGWSIMSKCEKNEVGPVTSLVDIYRMLPLSRYNRNTRTYKSFFINRRIANNYHSSFP